MPTGKQDYAIWRQYCQQLMRMASLHAEWSVKTKTGVRLTPTLAAEFQRLNAELDTVTIATSDPRDAERRVAAAQTTLLALQNEVAAYRAALATRTTSAQSPVQFADEVARKMDALVSIILPSTRRLEAALGDLYAVIDPAQTLSLSIRVRDWMQTLRTEDYAALAELVHADTFPAAPGPVVATARQFLGMTHRARAAMNDWTLHQYVFQLVGLDIQNAQALTTTIPAAVFAELTPKFVAVGRAAEAVMREGSAHTRTLSEVMHDVLRAVATIDNFATIDAAVKNLFDLTRTSSAPYQRWRVIAAAGEQLMDLFFAYTGVIGTSNATKKMALQQQRAGAILGLLGPQ